MASAPCLKQRHSATLSPLVAPSSSEALWFQSDLGRFHSGAITVTSLQMLLCLPPAWHHLGRLMTCLALPIWQLLSDRCLREVGPFVVFSGRVAWKAAVALETRGTSHFYLMYVYPSTPTMLAGCPVNGGPSSGMRRSFLSCCYQDKITHCAQDLSKSAGTETIVLHSAFLWEEGVMCAVSVKVHTICLPCTQQACEYCSIWLSPQWNCTGICLPLGSVTLTALSLKYTQFFICDLIYIAECNSENQKSLSFLWVVSPVISGYANILPNQDACALSKSHAFALCEPCQLCFVKT